MLSAKIVIARQTAVILIVVCAVTVAPLLAVGANNALSQDEGFARLELGLLGLVLNSVTSSTSLKKSLDICSVILKSFYTCTYVQI